MTTDTKKIESTSKNNDSCEDNSVISERQLIRIEAVHRGFFYQHLYAAICLLMAGPNEVERVIVERDEDIEIVLPGRRIYVQVKTRVGSLNPNDIKGALQRFEEIRSEHTKDKRKGSASFIIASNAAPSASLFERTSSKDWPDDVQLHWPDGPVQEEAFLPSPPRSVREAVSACSQLAGDLPFALLKPETLTWKLASLMMFASAGTPPRQDHSFSREELPQLFEQLVIQMQELPAPPPNYRTQLDEPMLLGDQKVRIISGLSGAGKTAWVAEAAMHAPLPVTYIDVVDTPGPALASAVTREVAGRMFGRSSGKLGEILLPGASGLDMLGALSVKLGEEGLHAHIVIDNAHRVPASDIEVIVDRAPSFRFLLLGQPGSEVSNLEARLAIQAETLHGWDEDTIAIAIHDAGCQANFNDCERLARLTGGLPFYVLNAAAVATREYGGLIRNFCEEVEAQTHLVETAQEIILRRTFEGLPQDARETIAILSLADVALTRDEAIKLLQATCDLDVRASSARLRTLPRTGALELFGASALKIHDAVRIHGLAELAGQGNNLEGKAKSALLEILIVSISEDWTIAKLGLLIRLFGQLGNAKVLVEFATNELFHEMGVWPEIEPFLISIAASVGEEAGTRLWALDGLVFNDLRDGNFDPAHDRIEEMQTLIETGSLGVDEWLAWGMKNMLLKSMQRDAKGVEELLAIVEKRVPAKSEHMRVFRYNRALALFNLGDNLGACTAASQLAEDYYEELGISPADVIGRNAPQLSPLLPQDRDLTDTPKHLADTLDLLAQATGGKSPNTAAVRIQAMKFYQLANAFDSLLRVGLDLVDDFVWINDFIGARQILESNIFPVLQGVGLSSRVLETRALYAVVLAYCGDHEAASKEVERLKPFEKAMVPEQRLAFLEQKQIIERVRMFGGPRQREIYVPEHMQAILSERRGTPIALEPRKKVGRNERCPCGSGKKFKQCHGR
ncbi:SEC-C metal-binding domain-containing protein [Cochlodiniinecator piscidefendens]|uniref:SEC-C metal-binding domain-containing protein n=1 Tax=Cochlodiniinecator piscidefendens TaxID=2715756 RepID=UPI001E3CC58E|nr:SEC-C metal-binding domain-containing protein [Cochlodiniinecator piscidefendens]